MSDSQGFLLAETQRGKHDELFKLLLETFFVEFLELFVPGAALLLDRNHVVFRQNEVIPNLLGKEKHVVDLLVETRLQDEDGLVLIHVETQSQRRPDYNRRMFLYACALYQKYQQKILPIVLYAHNGRSKESNTFCLGFSFLSVFQFSFFSIQLNRLDWRQYIRQSNPVAAALLSKMGYADSEKVAVKIEFARMLARMRLDRARQVLLTSFFDTYLTLNEAERMQYKQRLPEELAPEEVERVLQLTTSYHEEGRREGEVSGLRQSIVAILEDSSDYPHYRQKLEESLRSQTDKNVLLQWLRRSNKVSSVKVFLTEIDEV